MKAARVISFDQPRAPQVEDGYTRIANELFDAILGARLPARELSVVMAIIRKTYGYNKKQDDISASQIGALCCLARNHVTTTLKKLEAKQIIHKRIGSYGSVVGIQKDYSRWIVEGSPKSGLVPKQDVPSPSLVLVDSPKSVHTKDNLPKDNQQKTKTICATQALRDSFERFYSDYPKKRNRKDAEKAFAKLNPDAEQLDAIVAGLARCKLSEQWRDQQYIPYPASWLNAGGWMDEVQTEYAADELAVIAAYNNALADVSGEIDAAIFTESRAGAIRHFRTLSAKPAFWATYFAWVAQNCQLPPSAGFDWLISSDGFSKVKGGQFNKR